jgi:hypothetical protein
MRVFISWSGAKGRKLADALHKWIPAVLQAAKPYFSPDDVSKGARWSTEIGKTLEESRVGLICVTRDSANAPWVVFEAGALSKSLESSMVIPILFDLETTDVTGPLVQFQSARFSRGEMKRVIETINKELTENRLDAAVLDEVFDMWWPKLEVSVQKILEQSDETSVVRTDRDMLEEILTVSRSLAKAQARPAGHRADGIPKAVIVDLLAGLRDVTLAAATTFSPQDFTIALATINRPVNYLVTRLSTGIPKEDMEPAQVELAEARELFKKAVDETDELPF